MYPERLTVTQFFLRFLKTHGIYSEYIKGIHSQGRQAIAEANQENPLSNLKFDPNEMLWIQMMKWCSSKKDTPDDIKHFWEHYDGLWTRLWINYRYKVKNGMVTLNNEYLPF